MVVSPRHSVVRGHASCDGRLENGNDVRLYCVCLECRVLLVKTGDDSKLIVPQLSFRQLNRLHRS